MGRMEEWKISSHATLKSHSSGADDWSAVTLQHAAPLEQKNQAIVVLLTLRSSGAGREHVNTFYQHGNLYGNSIALLVQSFDRTYRN